MSLKPWMETTRRILPDLWSPKLDGLNAFIENSDRFKLVYEDNQVEELDTGCRAGVGISAHRGTQTDFFSFGDREEFKGEAPELAGMLGSEGRDSLDWSSPRTRSMPVGRNLSAKPHRRKLDRVREANEAARSQDDRIRQVRVVYSEKCREFAVLDAEGWVRREQQQYVNFVVQAVGKEDGRRESGHSRAAAYQGEEFFDEVDPAEVAREAASQAVTALEAEPVQAGPTTVVIASGFGGTIFHEACGHGFEADHIYEDVSQYAGRMGEQVASEAITFVDDGSLSNRYGGFCFDDEGTPSGRNVLIRDGVMESMMSDRKYAGLLGRDPSGNGRRQSFHHPVLPRMTNTFIENGDADPERIIEDTEDGVYAARIGGGQVDPASGDFIFSISEGYRIRNGEVAEPIRDAALVGNGPAVLNRVDAVGNDLDLQPGMCGKGQWVPVCVGQPTLRVRELTIGGDES